MKEVMSKLSKLELSVNALPTKVAKAITADQEAEKNAGASLLERQINVCSCVADLVNVLCCRLGELHWQPVTLILYWCCIDSLLY